MFSSVPSFNFIRQHSTKSASYLHPQLKSRTILAQYGDKLTFVQLSVVVVVVFFLLFVLS